MRNFKDIIIEKLKVSTKDNGFVPFNSISVVEFARALRKSGTIFIENYTDELISDKRYARKYKEMYLYSIGLQHPSEPYPMEIEFEYRTKDKVGTRRDIIKDEEYLHLKRLFAEGGDFQSLIENIYNDIM
jgi:hypothetical protein